MSDRRLPASIRSLADAVGWWAARTPLAPAILPDGDDTPPISFAELHRRADALAVRLRGAGVSEGNLVAVAAEPRVDAVVTIVGAMRAGVALPLAPGFSENELSAIITRLGPACCVAFDRHSAAARAARAANVPVLLPGDGGSPDCSELVQGCVTCAAGDVSLVLHSSGTTGSPRGIPRTNRNLLASAAAYAAWVGHEGLSRTLLTTPLSFGMGAHALCATFCAGGAVILPQGSPGSILRAISRWRPTWGYVVPALLETVVDEVERSRAPAAEWRVVGTAGMAPASDLAERVQATFGVPLAEGYGCGETGLIAGRTRAGHGAPGTMDRVFIAGIATVDDRGAPTPPGSQGEIVVWGPQVSDSYLSDAEATAAEIDAGGRFRTGDVGILDESGMLRLIGRANEIINRGGEKIAPAEIDAALMTHPAVVEAAAFPIPDRRLGAEVAAAVVLHPGLAATERDLRRHAARILSPAKVPRHVWFVAALPRTATGKVRRGELTRTIADASDG